MSYSELPLVFDCEGDRLVGVIAKPVGRAHDVGVLIVVGGPQYRAGSHRQFTLLARDLAGTGVASLRFDYRGMGDSEGQPRTFEAIEADIAAAIDTFFSCEPTLNSVVIWGLCDAASAALIYGYRDQRVSGLILLNPWVHTEESSAHARLKHYYVKRLISLSLWDKLFSGQFDLIESIRGFFESLRASLTSPMWTRKLMRFNRTISPNGSAFVDEIQSLDSQFISRMLRGLQRFSGDILFVLSGNDLTAQEFTDLMNKENVWRKACQKPQISKQAIPRSNHTFSHWVWRQQVSDFSIDFIKKGGSL